MTRAEVDLRTSVADWLLVYAFGGHPMRSSRCSPTRRAFAMIVKVGFTAPIETKKLESTR